MIRPKHANLVPLHGTSNLLFFDGQEWSESEQMLRGGICWPVETEYGGVRDVQGFALLVGLDVSTGKLTVWEQRAFVVVDSVIEDGKVMFPGVGPWFNACWSRYYASDWFWHQPDEAVKQYRLEVIRSEMVSPKPSFIEVPWAGDQEAASIVWKAVKTRRLRFERDSELHKQMAMADGAKGILPAVHALTCALAGIERFPYMGN